MEKGSLNITYVLPACKPGFFGDLCDSPCPPGTFGKNCGGECRNCSVEDCDPVYGCLKTIMNVIETTYQGRVFGERICLYGTHSVLFYF